MTRPFAETLAVPHAGGGAAASVPPLAAATRSAFEGVGFALLCLLTGNAPSAVRRQLGGGWDAGFAPQQPA